MMFGAGIASSAGQVPANGQPAASTLPAAQPTTTPIANVTAAQSPGSSASATTAKPEARLEVTFSDGMLTVDAANASLNQVLRQVSQKTGMKVTGTVAEESVFGHYGPLPASEVLASLLDGTGSNMLLVDNKTGPGELVLTPRRGGATPPSTNNSYAGNFSRSQGDPQEQYVPPVRPFQPPAITGRGPVNANADGSPAFGQPSGFGPGGIPVVGDQQRTPQQIYEQLQTQGSQQQPTPQDQ